MALHPAYLVKSEYNTISVDTKSEDYQELKKSIELNGVKDPVLARIGDKGTLEIISGQRRHMIATELNYPVPAIIQKISDADAKILVADGNLHRPKISTYDLARSLRMKMEGMKQKSGRRKKGTFKAEELDSDVKLAQEMGMPVSKLNRLIRLSEATKDVCDRVDDNSLSLSLATKHYQDDLIMDVGQLSAAMRDPVPENRVFLWMCRPCGTWCFWEWEVYLRDTEAHNTWTYPEYIAQADQIKAYRITVDPGQPGPSSLVPGAIQPLNYREQVERVKRLALPIHQVTLAFECGETRAMSYADYSSHSRELICRFGPIGATYYQPENKGELDALLYAERHPPKQRSRRPKRPPTR